MTELKKNVMKTKQGGSGCLSRTERKCLCFWGVRIGPHLYCRSTGSWGELQTPSLSQQETASWL